MIEFYAFASAHPFWAFMFAWLTVRYAFKFFRQVMRSVTVTLRGYPPPWCDSDGDFPKPEKPADAGKDQK